MTGFIYAISLSDCVKFGFSKEPWNRLYGIRRLRPEAEMIGFVAGTKEQEKELHYLLGRHRFNGETYLRCPAIDAVVSMFPKKARPPFRRKANKRAINDTPERVEARALLTRFIPPGSIKHKALKAAADHLGWSPSRVKDLYYGTARVVLAAEIRHLRGQAPHSGEG